MTTRFYPFYVDIQFEGNDLDVPSPFDPVKKLTLAYPKPVYEGGEDLDIYEFADEPGQWRAAAGWISEFCDGRTAMPVGFDLRNRVWPALVANVVKHGGRLPQHLMLINTKWNNTEMVDVKNLVLQGAFSKNDKITLESIGEFMFGKPDPTAPKPTNIGLLHDILRIYMGVAL